MSMPTCPSCIYAQGICEKTGVKIRYSTGCTYHTPKRITKADRIRAMSDEELAGFCFCITDDVASYYGGDGYEQKYPVATKGWLDWLRQEVNDD